MFLRSPRIADRQMMILTLFIMTHELIVPAWLQRQSNQQIITLDVTSTLGHGGAARVFGTVR